MTNASTYQFYTGHRPGHNLFGGSVIALDVKTGKRKWHFQVHHSDQWNYDIPTAPILMDLTVNGRKIPALIQNTKQGLIFALNRETGEPIWPIEERPVMQTEVPGNYTAPTQPYPTRPEPLDRIVLNGITEEFVLDYTPELKRRAMEILSKFRVGGLYVPPLPYPHKNSFINNVGCVGGLNIYHPPVADPTTGIMYASHTRNCSAPSFLVPTGGVDEERTEFAGKERGGLERTGQGDPHHGHDGGSVEAGRPSHRPPAAHRRPAGLQAALPGARRLRHEYWREALGPSCRPDSCAASGTTRFSREWMFPIREEPATPSRWSMGDLLVQTTEDLRGEAEVNANGMPLLHAREKRTGKILASVELPIPGQYGMMTFMHEGKQYILVQAGSARREQPGSLVALTLP